MAEPDFVPTSDDAVELFKACCICIGYCYDRGRMQQAEIFMPDLSKLILRMADDEGGRMESLCNLMKTTENRWIKYHAAAYAYVDYGVQEAQEVLEELEREKVRLGGLVRPLATVALASGFRHVKKSE